MSTIYKHKRTGELYALLLSSFSVERQRPTAIYMQLKTGAIFDRDWEKFYANFKIAVPNAQSQIVPKEPHA